MLLSVISKIFPEMICKSVFGINIGFENIPELRLEVRQRRQVKINIFSKPYQVNSFPMLRYDILGIK